MSRIEDRILGFIASADYEPAKPKTLGKKLGITKKTVIEFRDVLTELISSGRARISKDGRVKPPARTGLLHGRLKTIRSGDGYVNLLEPTDKLTEVFIDIRDMRDALSGDEVLVKLTNRRRGGGKRCGTIEEVTTRAASHFVGSYFETARHGMVNVDGDTFQKPVPVGDPGAKDVNVGDKVVIELIRYPSHNRSAEGVITKVLGPAGEPEVDLLAVVHGFGLPFEFPDEVLEEARVQAEQFDEKNLVGREDWTKETIITIDPATARDFDDAISLKRSKDKHWHLAVHIADVTHFVPEGSLLDDEAQHRGTSAYLPRHVIPMLPEVISNGLASLQEKTVRFAKTVLIEFTAEGIPVSTSFHRTAIKVRKRFAYEQVMPIVKDPDEFKSQVSTPIRELLGRMYKLAMILRKRRIKNGALELSLSETSLDYDKAGHIVGAHQTQHDESHQIIEEFMLAANIAVAVNLTDRGVPFLRRIHPDPSLADLKKYASFVSTLGFEIKNVQSRFALQEVIEQASGHPAQQAINFALLRSLKQAEYSPKEVGHYGLGEENYCHFTSPIRRYPDLVVHRMLDRIIDGRKRIARKNESELEKLGRHCSSTERRAEKAERDLLKLKLLRFMSERVGEEMDAVITGVENFGFFCQGVDIPAEGLVHITELRRLDQFTYDPSEHSLTGERTGQTFRLGEPVKVQVSAVDIDRRKLDLRVAESGSKQKSAKTKVDSGKKSPKRPRRGAKADGAKADRSKAAGSKRPQRDTRKKKVAKKSGERKRRKRS